MKDKNVPDNNNGLALFNTTLKFIKEKPYHATGTALALGAAGFFAYKGINLLKNNTLIFNREGFTSKPEHTSEARADKAVTTKGQIKTISLSDRPIATSSEAKSVGDISTLAIDTKTPKDIQDFTARLLETKSTHSSNDDGNDENNYRPS